MRFIERCEELGSAEVVVLEKARSEIGAGQIPVPMVTTGEWLEGRLHVAPNADKGPPPPQRGDSVAAKRVSSRIAHRNSLVLVRADALEVSVAFALANAASLRVPSREYPADAAVRGCSPASSKRCDLRKRATEVRSGKFPS
jgi:hypothetical protein